MSTIKSAVGATPTEGSTFFSNLGEQIGPYLGQSLTLAASALPNWTAAQLAKQQGNQLANPTFYYPASDPRLSTPLYTTQPLLWSQQGVDQYGNPVPSGYMSDFGNASLSFGQMAVMIAAAIAAVVILTR